MTSSHITTASWASFEAEAPDIAATVRGRIDAFGLALLATLRADGSPRISGIEPLIAGGELWLGMMPNSVKSLDLRRDPRLAMHNATTDKDVSEGDVKLSGRAVAVADPSEVEAFRRAFADHAGAEPPPGPMDLWRVALVDATVIRPVVDHLSIDTWHAGRGTTHTDRY